MREKVEQTNLEYVCKIANSYKITPQRVIYLCNRVKEKDYIDTELQALRLTERYVRRHYPPKTYDTWKTNIYLDFHITKDSRVFL